MEGLLAFRSMYRSQHRTKPLVTRDQSAQCFIFWRSWVQIKAADRLYSLKSMWSSSIRSGKAVSTTVVLHNFLIHYSVFFLSFDFPFAAADGVANYTVLKQINK